MENKFYPLVVGALPTVIADYKSVLDRGEDCPATGVDTL